MVMDVLSVGFLIVLYNKPKVVKVVVFRGVGCSVSVLIKSSTLFVFTINSLVRKVKLSV